MTATATARIDLLTGLTDEEAQQILALGIRQHVASGSRLFELGGVAECVYVIQRGRLRLLLPIRLRGRDEEVAVEERGPGDTVGWSALIPPFRFTLTASAPLETEVIAFSRDVLQSHFASRPGVGHRVAMNLAAGIGQRLQLFQAMWLREMQRTVELRSA